MEEWVGFVFQLTQGATTFALGCCNCWPMRAGNPWIASRHASLAVAMTGSLAWHEIHF